MTQFDQGQSIRSALKTLEMTRQELAEACGLEKKTLDAYLAPEGSASFRLIPFSKLKKIEDLARASTMRQEGWMVAGGLARGAPVLKVGGVAFPTIYRQLERHACKHQSVPCRPEVEAWLNAPRDHVVYTFDKATKVGETIYDDFGHSREIVSRMPITHLSLDDCFGDEGGLWMFVNQHHSLDEVEGHRRCVFDMLLEGFSWDYEVCTFRGSYFSLFRTVSAKGSSLAVATSYATAKLLRKSNSFQKRILGAPYFEESDGIFLDCDGQRVDSLYPETDDDRCPKDIFEWYEMEMKHKVKLSKQKELREKLFFGK
jgi:hypothetical protein